jgi:hypothetical protein
MTVMKRKSFWLAAPLLCAAVVAFVLAGSERDRTGATSWKENDLALGQPALYKDPIEELSLTLTSSGFAPAEIRAHGKKFLLSLDNRTAVKELVLRLSRSDGLQIKEIRVPGGGGDWSELFELPPGNYKFSEANHENWSCTISTGN